MHELYTFAHFYIYGVCRITAESRSDSKWNAWTYAYNFSYIYDVYRITAELRSNSRLM